MRHPDRDARFRGGKRWMFFGLLFLVLVASALHHIYRG
jgi:hypothetical protein